MSSPFTNDPMRLTRVNGCLVLLMLLCFTCLMPLMFVQMFEQALRNLHLSPSGALMVMIGIIFGSAINLPLYSIPREHAYPTPSVAPLAGWPLPFPLQAYRNETVVAVNVGGCIIPVLLAAWLLPSLVDAGARVVGVLVAGIILNTAICFQAARPVPNLGIAMPAFIPPVTAFAVAMLGLGDPMFDAHRAPVAFIVGISGPLLGADLLHWRQFSHIATGMVSIGGAGTWDGIVLSGVLAAFFA
ncbi:MAG TPA: DUF1614 domain-containing protein [Planctomycetaceae bacterium]|nr:DUF1614 domain-containing protein [Planctomycetaceae bacterium]